MVNSGKRSPKNKHKYWVYWCLPPHGFNQPNTPGKKVQRPTRNPNDQPNHRPHGSVRPPLPQWERCRRCSSRWGQSHVSKGKNPCRNQATILVIWWNILGKTLVPCWRFNFWWVTCATVCAVLAPWIPGYLVSCLVSYIKNLTIISWDFYYNFKNNWWRISSSNRKDALADISFCGIYSWMVNFFDCKLWASETWLSYHRTNYFRDPTSITKKFIQGSSSQKVIPRTNSEINITTIWVVDAFDAQKIPNSSSRSDFLGLTFSLWEKTCHLFFVWGFLQDFHLKKTGFSPFWFRVSPARSLPLGAKRNDGDETGESGFSVKSSSSQLVCGANFWRFSSISESTVSGELFFFFTRLIFW